MLSFSVIICTYNPVPEIFGKCLNAILKASLLKNPDEVIIIDNNSTAPLADESYIGAFIKECKTSKVVVEQKQGLTNARLRGIKESSSHLLIFVDDDNIVDVVDDQLCLHVQMCAVSIKTDGQGHVAARIVH